MKDFCISFIVLLLLLTGCSPALKPPDEQKQSGLYSKTLDSTCEVTVGKPETWTPPARNVVDESLEFIYDDIWPWIEKQVISLEDWLATIRFR